MGLYETALSAGILAAIGIWIYSSIKKQSAKDTIQEIKEMIEELRGVND